MGTSRTAQHIQRDQAPLGFVSLRSTSNVPAKKLFGPSLILEITWMSTVKRIMVKKKEREKEREKKPSSAGRHQIPGDLFQEAQMLALEDQGQVSPGNYFKEHKTKNCFSGALRLRGSGTQE